jgi:hypothetical protein
LGQPTKEDNPILWEAKSMANVFLRPDLKTAGGEISDILLNGRYVGSLSLVFREYDRVSGAIQLEKPSLAFTDKDDVLEYLNDYIQALAFSVEAEECTVSVTYSPFDRFIDPFEETEVYQGQDSGFYKDDEGLDEEIYFDDVDRDEFETLDMDKEIYHLVIVGEDRRKVEYHIYDDDQEWVAEAMMHIQGEDVAGEVYWLFEPTEEEIEDITELLVSDFDEEDIDTFVINHNFEDERIETIDLTHADLLDYAIEESPGNRRQETGNFQSQEEEDYTVVLARDDEDMLTYEIYKQSHGGLPIGTATVDISQRLLTGFIDFRDPANPEDLDKIAALLMRELDKEKEYTGINLTMLYQNEPVDEMIIECEKVH